MAVVQGLVGGNKGAAYQLGRLLLVLVAHGALLLKVGGAERRSGGRRSGGAAEHPAPHFEPDGQQRVLWVDGPVELGPLGGGAREKG